ncbi:MAG: PD40 domain-containing protein [bacterium]|nr:MAG: PD40 domain-containing protein [bacterium]
MNDNMLKKLSVFWGIFSIILVIACSSTQKTIKQTTLASTRTNLSFLLHQLEENPKDPNIYYKLSKVYADLDSLDYALVAIDTALSLDPKMNLAKLMRANLLLKKNRIKEGYTEYLEILNSETGDEYVDEIRMQLGKPYPIFQLTRGDYNNAFPCFSPDDKRITFQSDRDGNWEIYLMDVDGAQEVRLTNHEAQDEMPVFGSNENIIAFTSTRDDSIHKGRLDKARNIYLMDIIAGTVIRIGENEADDWYPAPVGNGNQVVFVSERDDLREVPFHEKWSDIYIYNLHNASILRLTQNEVDDGSPSVSSNGKWILFTSNRTDSYQIHRMDLKGNMVQQLTFAKGNCGAPHFSHDGKMITFFVDINGNYDIYMMDHTGQNIVQLTNDPAQDSYPRFSPDKRKIIFHSDRMGKYQIYWIDLMNPLTQEGLVRDLEEKIALME